MSLIRGISNNVEVVLASSKAGELKVRAIIEEEIEHASATGDSYSWATNDGALSAGDTALLLKNVGDKQLIVDRVHFLPSNVQAKYYIGIGTDATTPVGTLVQGGNITGDNLAKLPDAIAYNNETAIADAFKLLGVVIPPTESKGIKLSGVVLGKNQYLQINCETTVTSGELSVFAHFQDEII